MIYFIITTTKYTTKSSIMLCPYYTPENFCYAGIVLLPSPPHSIKTAFAVNVSKTDLRVKSSNNYIHNRKLRKNYLLLTSLLDSSCSWQRSISQRNGKNQLL